MVQTTFVDKTTVIEAEWLNDVDGHVWNTGHHRYLLGTTAAATQHTGAATGFIIETDYFDTNRTLGSGSEVAYTGTTTGGNAGNWPNADGFFYDADGKQFQLLAPYTIEQFGAIGDGATDSTAAIVAALAARGASEALYFLAGTYLTDKITVPFASLTLTGEHPAVTILKLNASQNTDLIDNSMDDFTIEKMTLDGNGANQSGTSRCMVFTAGTRTTLIDVEMKAGRTQNFLMIANTYSKLTRVRSHSSTVGQGGQIGESGSTTNDHLLTDCQFDGNLFHGLIIGKSGSTTRRVTIIGGISETNGIFAHGYFFDNGLQNAEVIGVTAHGNRGADGFRLNGASRVIFNGCTAYAQVKSGAVLGNGFNCTNSSDSIVFNGCISHTNGDNGFTINKNCSFINVNSCQAYNNSQNPVGTASGLQFTADGTTGGSGAQYININGGNYYDTQGPATQEYGIETISTLRDAIIDSVMGNGNNTSMIRDLVGDGQNVRITNVRGYNPVGNVTPPAHSSGTVRTNNFPHPVRIYLTGGTVSNIQIGGQSTGLTAGTFYVDPGDTIEVTYSGEPSWVWMGV